ncbi:MAG: hypothetical protein IKV45_03010 [Firmicutes bacterium]|nr:hypothetical protein [Bacillota bacterium]
MEDGRSSGGFDQSYQEGWEKGRDRLFFAFMLSVSLSRGLSPDDINELAEFCAILSNCLTYISGREQYFIE